MRCKLEQQLKAPVRTLGYAKAEEIGIRAVLHSSSGLLHWESSVDGNTGSPRTQVRLLSQVQTLTLPRDGRCTGLMKRAPREVESQIEGGEVGEEINTYSDTCGEGLRTHVKAFVGPSGASLSTRKSGGTGVDRPDILLRLVPEKLESSAPSHRTEKK